MHSDHIADMLTRLRNGCTARLKKVAMPHSNMKVRIAEILKREGYVQDFRVVGPVTAAKRTLEVTLRYDEKRLPVMGGIKRISSPGLRRYFGHDEIPSIRNGLGTIILTTNQGLMTDSQARAAKVGGEALCSVW